MEWRIDTGLVGEANVKDLRKVLEESRDHWLATQSAEASRVVFARHLDNAAKPGQPSPDHATVAKLASEARDAHDEKAESLLDHMGKSIDVACNLATMLGGIVTVNINGHSDNRHPSGAKTRISITVDQVEK